ncbi:hypothetical protein [Novosphingobium sp. M1R2S20]|uniref:SURF1-like protein n=1 Tax=Novosphingobium rhizovicinum TaxID=3228928 RepID=A0ABV3R6J5_9SPHN
MTWLWVLLALIALALVIWWIAGSNENEELANNEIVGAEPVAVAPVDPVAPASPNAGEGAFTIASILETPATYIGRDDFQADVAVPEVPTDRGFWVEHEGRRMFAIIIDAPREVPKDINAGQQLRVRNGMVRDATFLSDLPGKALDADTRRIANEQDAFLVVDEDDIEIMSRP